MINYVSIDFGLVAFDWRYEFTISSTVGSVGRLTN
jgi:hypothetical protein